MIQHLPQAGSVDDGSAFGAIEIAGRYVTQLGIAAESAPFFADAMGTIDELSDVRTIAGNVGFNLGWDVNVKGRSFGIVWWWGNQSLENGRDRFVTTTP